MKIVLTGATGFVGSKLLDLLPGAELYALGRSKPSELPEERFFKTNIDGVSNYRSVLIDSEVVIHCAGRVHVMENEGIDSLSLYRAVNTIGTLSLVRQAVECGVKRFVFLSSVKVLGENTNGRGPFGADDLPSPLDPYATSKLEAEEGLKKIAVEGGMEFVIIRPVLVYGLGVKANFLKMIRWLDRGFVLPFAAIKNKRSLVSIENLVDFIVVCVDHPKAENQTFLISDGQDLSTSELLVAIGVELKRPAKLFFMPQFVFRVLANIFNKKDLLDRIMGSLEVDISKNKRLLGWVPKTTVKQGLESTVKSYLRSKQKK